MYIAIIDPEVNHKYIQAYIDASHTIFLYDQKHKPQEIDALIIRSQITVDKALLDKYSQVAYIFRVGVGLEKVDLDACKKRNIQVINTPGANSQAVADLVIWWLLSLLRKGYQAYQKMKQWTIPNRDLFTGHGINSQNISILWFGNVGEMIAKRLQWFSPKEVSFYDPFIKKEIYGAKKRKTIEEILQKADCIILALPLLPATKHLINEQSLKQCKEDLKIINIWRGWVVDEEALYTFLKNNPNSWAYIDIRENEPEHTNRLKQLLSLDNFLITPHIASKSHEAEKNMHSFKFLIE